MSMKILYNPANSEQIIFYNDDANTDQEEPTALCMYPTDSEHDFNISTFRGKDAESIERWVDNNSWIETNLDYDDVIKALLTLIHGGKAGDL